MSLRLTIDEPWPFVAMVIAIMFAAVVAVWVHTPGGPGGSDD